MKKLLFSITLLVLTTAAANAQVPEDAIRYSWYPQNASARILGAGGVMGSVGGDITAGYVNPAGIGFYRVSEAVFTSGFGLTNTKASYRGNTTKESSNAFSFGPSGAIIARQQNRNNRSDAIAISFTQNASFKNTIHYKGLNNYSSYAEQFAEEFSGLNKSISEVLNTNSIAPYTAAPALYTYLIDTVRVNGNLIVKAAPEYILDQGKALQQDMIRNTKGGLYEVNLAYGSNLGAKWLWGASVGIPLVNYESNTVFSETDTSADQNNHFRSFSFTDNFTTKGAGVIARLGVIYRPKEYIRLGFAIHTPTYMTLTDSRQTTLHTIVENPVFDTTINSTMFTNGERGEAKYVQTSPLRAVLSASYVFREITEVSKQRGFLSADIEYVNHNGSRFSSDSNQPTSGEKAYYKELNTVVKDIYKGNFNFRVGGELKFNTIMARLGFGYYGSPYKEAPSKANKMTFSGGLGYRNKGFFVDLTYVHLVTNDFDVPYRLAAAQNTYASLKQMRENVLATVGVKF